MAAFTEAKFDAVVPVKMKALITAIAVYTLLDTYGLHRAAVFFAGGVQVDLRE